MSKFEVGFISVVGWNEWNRDWKGMTLPIVICSGACLSCLQLQNNVPGFPRRTINKWINQILRASGTKTGLGFIKWATRFQQRQYCISQSLSCVYTYIYIYSMHCTWKYLCLSYITDIHIFHVPNDCLQVAACLHLHLGAQKLTFLLPLMCCSLPIDHWRKEYHFISLDEFMSQNSTRKTKIENHSSPEIWTFSVKNPAANN